MQRLSRLYVSHFGSPTAWYDHLLFDLEQLRRWLADAGLGLTDLSGPSTPLP